MTSEESVRTDTDADTAFEKDVDDKWTPLIGSHKLVAHRTNNTGKNVLIGPEEAMESEYF